MRPRLGRGPAAYQSITSQRAEGYTRSFSASLLVLRTAAPYLDYCPLAQGEPAVDELLARNSDLPLLLYAW